MIFGEVKSKWKMQKDGLWNKIYETKWIGETRMKIMVIMNLDGDIHEMNQKEVKKYQEFLIEKKKSNLWERIKKNINKNTNEGE